MPSSSGRVRGGERRRNLALVLARVHVAPQTRSGLTRASGLNRSTIGGLVADLEARGLVVEDEPAADGQVGRPSPVVRAGDAATAVAVNPEVDSVTVSLVRLGGRVVASRRVPLAAAPSPEQAVAVAAETAEALLADAGDTRAVGAALAVPGIIRAADGVVRLAPHLGWRDVPLAAMLSDRLGMPVAAGNDAALGARAEWLYGAGRGVDDLLYLNGGASGIGGGVVAGGRPLSGARGHAGEVGHSLLAGGDRPDTIGLAGTLEGEVRRADLLSALGIAAAASGELEARLLAARDPDVDAVVARQVDVLATAIANAATVLDPARVVLGGFLSALAAATGDRLQSLVAQRLLPGLGEQVEVRRSELGDTILAIGAAELAFAPLLADPASFHPV